MRNDLIFDFGFNDGSDSEHYLSLGYDVVAVEADISLYKQGLNRFEKEIKDNRIVILNNAFSDTIGEKISFYRHPNNLDWSTCDIEKTKFWEVDFLVEEVTTVNLPKLFHLCGLPYYIKTDIEGLDYLVLTQLQQIAVKPKYLSFELSRIDYYKIFSYLYVCGYTKFQLVNQMHNKPLSSGNFGELLPDKWISFDEVLTQYMKYKELKEIDNINLALGWIDIHAMIGSR